MAFETMLEIVNGVAKITLIGELDATVAAQFKERIEEAASHQVKRLALLTKDLEYMSSAGLRVLVFASQKMGSGVIIYLVGAQEQIIEPIKQTGLHHSLIIVDTYDPVQIEGV